MEALEDAQALRARLAGSTFELAESERARTAALRQVSLYTGTPTGTPLKERAAPRLPAAAGGAVAPLGGEGGVESGECSSEEEDSSKSEEEDSTKSPGTPRLQEDEVGVLEEEVRMLRAKLDVSEAERASLAALREKKVLLPASSSEQRGNNSLLRGF